MCAVSYYIKAGHGRSNANIHVFYWMKRILSIDIFWIFGKNGNIVLTVHSYPFGSRFHARMKICLQKGTKGTPLYEQK